MTLFGFNMCKLSSKYVIETGLLSKLLVSLMRNNFPKWPSNALLHTLSKLYDVHFVLYTPPSFEQRFGFISSRRRMAVTRHLMICLVLFIIWSLTTIRADIISLDRKVVGQLLGSDMECDEAKEKYRRTWLLVRCLHGHFAFMNCLLV